MGRFRLAVGAVAAASFLAVLPLRAQTGAASLRGVVRDTSQAVVMRAAVTLTNVDQNRTWTALSNDRGEYDIEQIPPGHYALAVELPGFKKYVRPGLTLEVNQVAEIDVTLEPGAVTETVEVRAEAPLLESATSALGEVVNHLTTVALPLNGRNVMQLVALTPGINTPPNSRGAAPFASGNIGSVGFSANGGRNLTSEVLLDGSPQEVMGYNQPGYVPPPDAVEEFKVITNTMSAEYGRSGGSVVSIIHRSGGKDFHGDLYEFLRNDALDANDFFDNRTGKPKAPFRFNQFGGTVGGPLTKSRQSTFFFFSYQGVREQNPAAKFFTVPTAAIRQGDFSASGSSIYDPATINAQGVRQPFPNNSVPASRFNPVALRLLDFYPAPNRPGVSNNFFSQAGSVPASDDYSVRIDRRISARQNLFGRFSLDNQNTVTANSFGNIASPDAGVNGGRSRSATLDDAYLLGGWVLHGNYGYIYFANPRDSSSEGFDLTTLGLPGSLAAESQFHIFPLIQPQGFAALGPNATFIIGNKFETHTWSGDALKLFGGHTVKFGGVYRLNRVSSFRPNSPAGNFSFSQDWTRQSFNGNVGGNAIASMLLGLMSSGVVQYQPALAIEVPYFGFYFQDDWRASNRLTFNLGLRWDSDRPMTERFNRLASFNFNATLPVQAPGLPPLVGGLQFVARNGLPRGVKNPDDNNFAPRIGLAFKVTDRFVMRSGFGIFYNPSTGTGPGGPSVGALTYDATTNVTTSIDGGRTPYTTLSNPFPDGYNQPTNGSQGLLSLLGQNINAQFRNDRTPYSVQWNYDLQYQFAGNSLFDVAYVGNAGVKLLAQTQLDQIPDADLALGQALTQKVANPFYGVIPATSSIGQATTTAAQLLRPYPQFTGVQQTWSSFAHSSYNSLQVKLRKRYANGLQFLIAYTWSKSIDDFSSVAGFLGLDNPGFTDNNNRRLDRSLSSLDVAHHFVGNYQYELPFGKGRRFLNRGGMLNAFAGGWSVNGVTTVQSGLPISITSSLNTTNSLGGAQRPDATGLTTRSSGSVGARIDNYFNLAAFAPAPLYAFGTIGRMLPDNRGPYLFNWDLSLLKQVPIHESMRLELRGEFFNAFNNVNFQNPTGAETVYGLPQFGAITATFDPRIVQVALKLFF
ncbi:MAG: carboxypeptidase regulatory-like domain-containing protein [Bryobacteraceae bacterium]